MNFRDTILQHVRANQPASRELPAVPKFHSGQTTDLKEQFVSSLKELSGEVVTDPPADFEEFLKKRFPDAQTISSAVPEYAGNKSPEDFVRWSDASGIDVTIVRSPLGVAETGSVILSEEEFRVNTIGFLAHDIVILLDPSDIVENINYAYGHPISGTKPIAC
jgi:L-lactate dehydrogenase complex protein LldG